MAGFILKSLDRNTNSFFDNIQRNIRYMSTIGMKWDQNIIKQSRSIGISEYQSQSLYNIASQQLTTYAGSDINQREFIAFFDKEYPTRREFLRRFAMNGEIEHILEVIADETIIQDDANFFCYPNTRRLKSVLKSEKAKEIVDDLNESFKKVYYAFGFNQGHDAWHYLKKFLIDGFLAFEIIYDGEGEQDAKNILGFKEIDPISLEPEIRKDEEGNEYRVWVQYRGDSQRQRVLSDASVIYISWARGNFVSRLSYLERLVRAFNMLRSIENSRIIWNVINAQYRMKIIVPIGTQSEVKARTRLSELRAMYKEDITIDYESAEITVNGQPNFSFAKQYIIPSPGGDSGVQIESFQPTGWDLSKTDLLDYLWKRFIIETSVPKDRFMTVGEGTPTPWTSGGESIAREEIRFSYFINRIRSIFQEILLKPTWIQFCLKHPIFMKDKALRGAIGLEFVEENLFIEAKKRDLASRAATIITTLSGIKEQGVDSEGNITEVNYFDSKFLIEKYMNLSEEDIKLNEKYKKERREQLIRLSNLIKRLNSVMNAQGENGGSGSSETSLPGGMSFGGGGFNLGGGSEGGAESGAGGELGGLETPEAGGGEAVGGEAGGGEVGGAGGEGAEI